MYPPIHLYDKITLPVYYVQGKGDELEEGIMKKRGELKGDERFKEGMKNNPY